MPHGRHRKRWLFGRLAHTSEPEPVHEAPARPAWVPRSLLDDEPPARRRSPRRLAATLTFATLFFAGAAFSAGAGDMVAEAVDATQAGAPAAAETLPAPGETLADDLDCPKRLREYDREECRGEEEPAPAAPSEPAAVPADPAAPAPADPAADPAAAPAETEAAAREQPTASPAETPVPEESEDARPRSAAPAALARGDVAARPRKAPAKPVIAPRPSLPRHSVHQHAKLEGFGGPATVWLDRDVPDPTPPSRRLTRAFARDLAASSRQHRLDWAVTLAVLRARGDRSQSPATRAGLDELAARLVELGARNDAWGAFLALDGRTSFADRTFALTRYHRAVGLGALVRGLEWAKPSLQKRLLRDERVSIYDGGRADLEAGRINVRVIVLLRYLAEAHGQVTVSSLETGHRIFARPGVVSAHVLGLAVDIAALEGMSITGHQAPGSVTERAVRNVLLLPAELRPLQVISLLGLGGPSFPMANHFDHIHVGY